jgi:hypothetical protein
VGNDAARRAGLAFPLATLSTASARADDYLILEAFEIVDAGVYIYGLRPSRCDSNSKRPLFF